MDVRFAGSGPAAEAVEAALTDAGTDARPLRVDPGNVGGCDLAVACGDVDGSTVPTAGETARGTDTPLLTVEAGGIGGHPVAGVEAAVAGFVPGAGCFDCLATRVAAGEPETGAVAEGPEARSAARLAGAIAGREAVKLLSGRPSGLVPAVDEETRLVGAVEIPHASRTVLPVQGCDCDPGHEPTFERTHRERSLDEAVDRAELALDERVGPIAQLGEAESFPAPYYLAHLADTAEFSDAVAAEGAAGVDADWNRALMKALGEGLERYAAGVYRVDDLREAPPGALDGAVSPDEFVRPDDGPDLDPDRPIRWAPARTLTGGDDRWLPAEVVVFPPPERRYVPPITTGLGLGNSPVEAALSGLYEVIERDATMIAWYSTFEPLELRVADERYRTLANRARSEGLSATALLVTVDVDVPVVAAAVHRESEWPKFAVGSAADLDPGAAATSALAEAIQNWMELRGMGPDEATGESTAIGRYADFPDEAREFLDAGGPIPAAEVGDGSTPSGSEELKAAVEAVADAGLVPQVAPLTPRDVERIGFSAVRVAVPGAQPLFTDRPAFGERAGTVPTDLGFEPRTDRDHHPYP